MRLSLTFLLAAVVASQTGFAQTAQKRAEADELAFMSSEHPAMRAAFAKAKATLPQFLALAKAPPGDASLFAVKVGIAADGKVEYFWITHFSENSAGYVGTIDNEPRMVRTVKAGQQYAFSRERIVDWMYVTRPPLRMHGNFTECALLSNESLADREAVQRQYGLRCE
jgi:uncharacterized protein YegJ (DUF2314 family)